ncbi:MAG TPA: RNA 2',3'-cyclic phosphodiesterase [Spirochaetia bacterium]|nr:RNA 2',3'-cyclic phosphodiesterase [Spirochaetia bacterium]
MDERTEKLRLFLALEPSPETREWLVSLQAMIRRDHPESLFRYVAPDNLHVTLQFLGDTPASVVPTVADAMLTVCSNFAPFEMAADGIGFFPGPERPRVMWIGANDETRTMDSLFLALGNRLAGSGIGFDKKPYHPHFTLAYVRKSAPRATLRESAVRLLATPGGSSPPTMVARVILLQSTLTPGGSVYREIASARFGAQEGHRD